MPASIRAARRAPVKRPIVQEPTTTLAAFRTAVRVFDDVRQDKYGDVSRALRTTRRALARYLSGEWPLPANGRLVSRLAEDLCFRAYDLESYGRAAEARRPRKAAQRLGADIYRSAFQAIARNRAAYEARHQAQHGRRYSAGLHVAPFLSLDERVMLVAIDDEQRFAWMTTVERTRGVALDNDRARRVDRDTGSDSTLYAHRLPWTGGIHFAPWRPPVGAAGECVSLLAIDQQYRLVASVDVPCIGDGEAVLSARQTLAAALEVADNIARGDPAGDAGAAGYSDGYEKDIDEYDAGDIWKRGTRYDHTQHEED